MSSIRLPKIGIPKIFYKTRRTMMSFPLRDSIITKKQPTFKNHMPFPQYTFFKYHPANDMISHLKNNCIDDHL